MEGGVEHGHLHSAARRGAAAASERSAAQRGTAGQGGALAHNVPGSGVAQQVCFRGDERKPPSAAAPACLTCGTPGKVALAASMPIRLGGLCSGARSEAFWIVLRTWSLQQGGSRVGRQVRG